MPVRAQVIRIVDSYREPARAAVRELFPRVAAGDGNAACDDLAVLQHRRVTYETVLGALCAYVLLGLLFAFVFLAIDELGWTFFTQPGEHP